MRLIEGNIYYSIRTIIELYKIKNISLYYALEEAKMWEKIDGKRFEEPIIIGKTRYYSEEGAKTFSDFARMAEKYEGRHSKLRLAYKDLKLRNKEEEGAAQCENSIPRYIKSS